MLTKLPPAIKQQCRDILSAEIRTVQHVGGGDINQARLLITDRGKFFIKLNTSPDAARMFETEAKGLDLMRRTKTVHIPEVIAAGSTDDGAFLLLEYIATGQRASDFWDLFGEGLAALHRHAAPQFGLDHANFIGSLPQSNRFHATWPDFYEKERLRPQLDLALHTGQLGNGDASLFEKLIKNLPDLCPAEPPALIHGDLWSGNFMVGITGQPVLVDPSVCYAHREMDLAMSRLFGGFAKPFYHSYEAAFPLEPGFEQRLPIYELYYLMVHVNLFGGGYVRSVRQVLKAFGG
mgnify:CR=1 FL=1